MRTGRGWSLKTPEDIANAICSNFSYNEITVFHMEATIARAIQEERARAQGLVEALQSVVDNWDIEDSSRVVPKLHEGELVRNDTLAAGSIIECFHALKKYKGEE